MSSRATGTGWLPQALLLLPVLLVTITCTLLLAIAPTHASGGCSMRRGPEMVAGGLPPPEPTAGWPPACAAKQQPAHR
jgi:hypothetical protein